MKPQRKFAGIDALLDDIIANYRGAEIGNIYDGKYRVISVGEGTPESIIERLTARKKTKLVYLIAEEIYE